MVVDGAQYDKMLSMDPTSRCAPSRRVVTGDHMAYGRRLFLNPHLDHSLAPWTVSFFLGNVLWHAGAESWHD